MDADQRATDKLDFRRLFGGRTPIGGHSQWGVRECRPYFYFHRFRSDLGANQRASLFMDWLDGSRFLGRRDETGSDDRIHVVSDRAGSHLYFTGRRRHLAGEQFTDVSLDRRCLFCRWGAVGGDNILRRDLHFDKLGSHVGIEQCACHKLERGCVFSGWDKTRGRGRWGRHLDRAIHSGSVVEHRAIKHQRCSLVDRSVVGFHVARES